MKADNLSSKSAGAGLFAAFAASLCCITPLLAVISGVGGIATTFSWIEPFRIPLIVLTVGALGFAWYQQLRPKTQEEIDCACDENPSFWQSRRLLGIITVFAGLMLSFPSYSHIFYPNSSPKMSGALLVQDPNAFKTSIINVEGMTCTGCENHIVHEVSKLEGVKSVSASYANKNAVIEYHPDKVKYASIVAAIQNTGYTVIDDDEPTGVSPENENISFFQVPLICNAAPSLGCGSRSRPVLSDFEQSDVVEEAWLNRAGTVIAVVWNGEANSQERRKVVRTTFTKYDMSPIELLKEGYSSNLASFKSGNEWYQGDDVNMLSKEEASIFAERLLVPIKNKATVNFLDEQKLRDKITDTFFDFFLNYEALEDLGDEEEYKSRLTSVITYGEDLLGEGSMPTLDELWSSCSNIARTCNHEGCTSSCKLPVKGS